MTARARVLIAEDHVLMANAIASWLHQDCEVVGRVNELSGLRAAIATTRPDVVLLDLAFAGESALLMLPKLVKRAVDTRFIILTAYGESSLMKAAMAAGAWGFVVKSSEFNEILHAIAEVMAGRMYQSSRVTDFAKAAPRRNRDSPPPEPSEFEPTPRQLLILKVMLSGIALRAAGKRLGLHHKTIEYHLRAAQDSLGLNTRPQLMRWAREYLRDHP